MAIKSELRTTGGYENVLYLVSICVSILVVILYNSFVRCYHWGKLAKGTQALLFLTTACESTIISK